MDLFLFDDLGCDFRVLTRKVDEGAIGPFGPLQRLLQQLLIGLLRSGLRSLPEQPLRLGKLKVALLEPELLYEVPLASLDNQEPDRHRPVSPPAKLLACSSGRGGASMVRTAAGARSQRVNAKDNALTQKARALLKGTEMRPSL